MGYEVRMIVAASSQVESDSYDAFNDEEDGLWVMVQAHLWLGKLPYNGAYHALLNKTEAEDTQRYFFYARDSGEETRVTHDLYGDRLLRLEPEEVLEALQKDAEDLPNYIMLQVAIATMEKFVEVGPKYGTLNELIVLHYGH